MDELELEEALDELLEEGFFIKDAEGQLRFGPDAETLHPELFRELKIAHMEEVDQLLWGLYHKGLMEIVGTNENGEFQFVLTEEAELAVEAFKAG